MRPQHVISLPETLYLRLQTLAALKGQSVETFVQDTLEDAIEDGDDLDPTEVYLRSLPPLPDPDTILPPYGSPEEAELRRKLAEKLSDGVSLSQMIIDERGER